MSDRTWGDIEQEIREDYLRSDAPENVSFRKVQWEVWLSELIRKEREDAWDECLSEMPLDLDWKLQYGDQNPYRKE